MKLKEHKFAELSDAVAFTRGHNCFTADRERVFFEYSIKDRTKHTGKYLVYEQVTDPDAIMAEELTLP